MPAPGVGWCIRIDDRSGIALRCAHVVAQRVPVAQPPNFAFVETQKPIPAILSERLDQILARARVVELDLVVEQRLPDRPDLGEVAGPVIGL